MALRREVYACDRCEGCGFERPAAGEPYFKFPPIIGAQGEAPLLFVGLNPRRSATNLWLHDRLMSDEAAFDALAQNRVDGLPYIGVEGLENHYQPHARIAAAVYPGRAFEEVAAVTELFHCATEDGRELPKGRTPCADRYLARVLRIVRPRVIVAVGKVVERRLRPRFGTLEGPFRVRMAGIDTLVVPIPHPNARTDRERHYESAANLIARELGADARGGASEGHKEDTRADSAGDTARPLPSRPARWPWFLLTVGSIASVVALACCCGAGG